MRTALAAARVVRRSSGWYHGGMPENPHRIRATEVAESGERTEYDAAWWFEQAADAQIRALRAQSYHAVVVELLPGEIHAPGREIIVNAGDAESWLQQHRPHLVQDPFPPR